MKPNAWLQPAWEIDFSLIASLPQSKHKISIGQALKQGQTRLASKSESANLDSQVLLAHILGVERSWLMAHPEVELNALQGSSWEAAISRLEEGEPLPYVLGQWEFYGLKFILNPDVLIPRPESELLVGTALEWLRAHPNRRQVVDVGTGSACIAISLAANIRDARIKGTDISQRALSIAAKNALRHDVEEQVEFLNTNLLEGLAGPFDLICANLPYIPSKRLQKLEVAKREPRLALDGGSDGLDLIRILLEQAVERLAPGGLILAEIDISQSSSAPTAASKVFPAAQIEMRRDLEGHPRLLLVQS